MSSATDLHRMFQRASSFNQDLSNWNTSSITDLLSMFQDATSFNRDLSSWNTSNIIYMDYLFSGETVKTTDGESWFIIDDEKDTVKPIKESILSKVALDLTNINLIKYDALKRKFTARKQR